MADVGAGTGKLTRALIAAGHRVVAIEPSSAMREALTQALPDVSVHDASAEATGLPDRSVDVAVFAQSWHWVDVGRVDRAGADRPTRRLRVHAVDHAR